MRTSIIAFKITINGNKRLPGNAIHKHAPPSGASPIEASYQEAINNGFILHDGFTPGHFYDDNRRGWSITIATLVYPPNR